MDHTCIEHAIEQAVIRCMYGIDWSLYIEYKQGTPYYMKLNIRCIEAMKDL